MCKKSMPFEYGTRVRVFRVENMEKGDRLGQIGTIVGKPEPWMCDIRFDDEKCAAFQTSEVELATECGCKYHDVFVLSDVWAKHAPVKEICDRPATVTPHTVYVKRDTTWERYYQTHPIWSYADLSVSDAMFRQTVLMAYSLMERQVGYTNEYGEFHVLTMRERELFDRLGECRPERPKKVSKGVHSVEELLIAMLAAEKHLSTPM